MHDMTAREISVRPFESVSLLDAISTAYELLPVTPLKKTVQIATDRGSCSYKHSDTGVVIPDIMHRQKLTSAAESAPHSQTVCAPHRLRSYGSWTWKLTVAAEKHYERYLDL